MEKNTVAPLALYFRPHLLITMTCIVSYAAVLYSAGQVGAG